MPKILKFSIAFLGVILAIWAALALVGRNERVEIRTVVLDAGHGGDDPGATSKGVYEKDINLAITLRVKQLLEADGELTVLLSRGEDVFVSLADRAAYANETGADLFVSIHANALENNDSFSGIYTFYHPQKRSDQALAQTIQSAAAEASGGIDRGVRSENYAVLRETTMSAILVETGFMTCPEELARLTDEDYQDRLAAGIAQGILQCAGHHISGLS